MCGRSGAQLCGAPRRPRHKEGCRQSPSPGGTGCYRRVSRGDPRHPGVCIIDRVFERVDNGQMRLRQGGLAGLARDAGASFGGLGELWDEISRPSGQAREMGGRRYRAGGGGYQEKRWSRSKPGSGWAMRSQSGIGPGSSSQAGGPRAGEHNNAAAAPVAPDHGRQCVQKLQARNRRCPSRACRGHHRHRAGRYAQTNAAPGGVAARRCR